MREITEFLLELAEMPEENLTSENLIPLIYQELRRLATWLMQNERPGLTIQATALVHEAYVRLVKGEQGTHWRHRGHFFGAAAEAMRRILIEQARKKSAVKYGGDFHRVSLQDALIEQTDPEIELIDLDHALRQLENEEPETAQIVKLRFFAGLTFIQIGDLLKINERTVRRRWNYARAWLYAKILDEPQN